MFAYGYRQGVRSRELLPEAGELEPSRLGDEIVQNVDAMLSQDCFEPLL